MEQNEIIPETQDEPAMDRVSGKAPGQVDLLWLADPFCKSISDLAHRDTFPPNLFTTCPGSHHGLTRFSIRRLKHRVRIGVRSFCVRISVRSFDPEN